MREHRSKTSKSKQVHIESKVSRESCQLVNSPPSDNDARPFSSSSNRHERLSFNQAMS